MRWPAKSDYGGSSPLDDSQIFIGNEVENLLAVGFGLFVFFGYFMIGAFLVSISRRFRKNPKHNDRDLEVLALVVWPLCIIVCLFALMLQPCFYVLEKGKYKDD